MQTSAVPFFNGRHTKGVPFLSRKSLKRVRCWTSSGASLQKLCCTPPWNTLPHKYGTPSQLRIYLATAPGQSAKIKRKSIDLPHLLPPPHPCYILTILQNCQHNNSPKLSFMTHMSGQVVLIEQRRKGASLGNSKLNVVLYLDNYLVSFVAKRTWVGFFHTVQRISPSTHHWSIQLYPFYLQLPNELTTTTKQQCF